MGLLLVTYYLVCITWVFFRAQDFSGAFALTRAMLIGGPNLMRVGLFNAGVVAVVTTALVCSHWFMRDRTLEGIVANRSWWTRALGLALLLVALILSPNDDRAFIYFQF